MNSNIAKFEKSNHCKMRGVTIPTPINEQNWSKSIEPVVSICCITYNHEQFVRESLESILVQRTTFPVEIIIHDDASTDNTVKIVKEYADRYPNMIRTIFQSENQWSKGLRPSMIAFSQCNGRYIAICEGDDYWIDVCKIQKQKDILDFYEDINLCFHSSLMWLSDKNKFSLLNFHDNVEKIIAACDIVKNDGGYMHTASLFFRSKCIDTIPKDIVDCAPVGDYLIQVFLSFPNGAYYINTPMSVYCRRGNGSWTDVVRGNNSNQIEFEKKFVIFLFEMKACLSDLAESFDFIIAEHCLSGMYYSLVEYKSKSYNFFRTNFLILDKASVGFQINRFKYLTSLYGMCVVRFNGFVKNNINMLYCKYLKLLDLFL